MGIVPENTYPRITWYRTRLANWAENFAALGLSAEEVAQLETKLAAAEERYRQQRMAQQLARTATSWLHLAMDELSVLGASMIGKIKATASMEGNGVYNKAWMPSPAEPSPIGAPGQPFRFEVQLRSLGDLMIKWKCKHPKGSEGTMYEVRRQLGSGPFEIVGLVGKKKFHDHTIPPGTANVTYRVTAVRSTRRGLTGEYTLNLGVRPGDQILFRSFVPQGGNKAAA